MLHLSNHEYVSLDSKRARRTSLLQKVVCGACIVAGALLVVATFSGSSNSKLGAVAIRARSMPGATMFSRGCASNIGRLSTSNRAPQLSAFSSITSPTKTDLGLDWSSLKSDLVDMIKSNQCGPIMIRLSWHDAGTYCKADGTGGARGAQRFEEGESTHGANAGLKKAIDLLADIQGKYPISASDLWAAASIVATEVMGGPKIPFRAGRDDIPDATQCVEEGRLPDGDKGADHLRTVFGRMGFSDKDIVVLSGAHTVGRCHADRSGFDGAWTEAPLQWDNGYFKNLMTKDYKPETTEKGNPQYRNSDADVIALETDLALTTDPEFKKYTELFASDADAFNKAYAETYQKLQELGWESKGLQEIAW